MTLKDSYYNMREMIEPRMEIVENMERAMKENGVEPHSEPVRGGTDGARLSFMGLPCPNICTGGANAHGKTEYGGAGGHGENQGHHQDRHLQRGISG